MQSPPSTSQTTPALPEQQPGGETAVTTIPAVSPAPSVPAKPGEDRCDYDACTIVLVVQFRPVVADQPRQLWVSVQNGVGNRQDFPLYRMLTEADLGGPFPPAVQALLDELRQDLPGRKERNAARQASQATPSASRPVTKPVVTQGSKQRPVEKQASLLPPTTSRPIPKGELTMGGLFDELD